MIVSGARVVTPGRDLGVADVRIENGVIAEVAAKVSPRAGERVIEADNLTLLPGFVDIHSHGRGGADFCDATDAAFDTIGRGKLADGVTGFLATGLTRPEEELAEILEGPFFNAEMAGAQNPAYLKKPDAAFVKRLHAISPVRKVSLAPELEGAEECIRELAQIGIVTSGGHSSADYETFERARKAGMTHLTHFCNAMMPIHHLRPTMVTGGLLADDVLVEIITDGVHLSDPMIKLIAKAKGPDRVLRVKVEKGRATLADVPYDPKAVVSNVAGSVALFPDCFRRFVRVTGWPLHEAVKAAGYNQLRSLGILARGEIAAGQVADLVLVDESLSPRMTIVGGEVMRS